ncbi:hypothetical protein B0A55_05369 [Friedmanniomyces simplex]|uniref:TOG domain-containing protein n=1 Tax=Friedmanniomyces simplex TaxID=329884 RepID=A0A4U0XRB2_9PEZI|nr:hypothetical protein B0A55_05369 [Friedmanniomyces simplex]
MSEEDEFKLLSLPDQFTHKNWKARKNGYETAAKDFKTAQASDPLVRDLIYESSLWKAAVADSNVAAQQEALNAYNAFLEAAGAEGAKKTRGHTVQGVVEKGLMGRPAAKASALETLMLLIELDKADPVIEELLPFLAHKQPKIIAATLAALASVYRAYGCKTVEPKPVVKLLPKVFGHADKNVRAEAQNLTVELYRWLREAMKPLFWGELKDVQQKDLDKLFEPIKAEPQPKQERLLRSQQAAVEEAAASGVGADGDLEGEVEDSEAPEIDLEPEYEAVDVLAKVPKDFSDRLASSKWKDRKEALDELFTAVNVPAMQEGSFDDIIRGCAKSMKDANIAVVTVAANCVECIAKGLRKSFTKYRGTILGAMLERFKEKKQTVTDAIAAACDAVFLATTLGEIESDVLEHMKSKNPQVKEHTTKFLIRSLKSTRDAPTIEQTKELAEGSKKLLTESVATLRDAGAEVLGVLWRIMGDRNMLNHLEGLDDLRRNKIKEFSDAAEVRAKWKPKAAPPPKPAAAPAASAGRKPTKRPAPGTAKKAAPAARAPSPPSEETAPLQPRPSSRPAPSKAPAGLRPPGAGLRAPGSGLAKPGVGLKAPSAGAAAASPKRQPAAPLDDGGGGTPTTAPRAGLAAPGRGLAGRPLAKPLGLTPASPPRQDSSLSSSALTSIEKQELSDLRAEVDLLRSQTSDLRTDKLRLGSRVMELENQEAQYIENHTRDMLQIKAKETQLVRARADAEEAEERGNSLGKEIERLKREMGRLHRLRGEGGAGEWGGAGGGGGRGYNGPAATRSYGEGNNNGSHTTSAGTHMYDRSGEVGGEEGKENIPDDHSSYASHQGGETTKMSAGATRSQPQQSSMPPPPQHSRRPLSNGSSAGGGRAPTPASQDGEASASSTKPTGMDKSLGQSEGVESWRRAAEVTQNLKARIEMMKQPKIIAATLAALASVYRAYGCKTVEPKPVVKLLPKVFGHADKNVRAEAQNLTVELYRWLREAMKPLFWGELKDVQQKDLDKLFEPIKAEPQPKQERLLRSQQAAVEEAAASGVGADGDLEGEVEDSEAPEIDLEPEYEAVDVLAKVPKDFSDRLAAIEEASARPPVQIAWSVSDSVRRQP